MSAAGDQENKRLASTLLGLVREDWERVREPLLALAPTPQTFISLCRECDVHPWVHSLLERNYPELAGSALMLELGTLRTKVRHDNMLLLARTEQALDLLAHAGVVPLALKGLDLTHRVYSDIDMRTLDDVDLLVRWEDLTLALEALEQGGWTVPAEPDRTHYIRSSHHLPLRSPGPVTVDFEIHWNLVQEERYSVDAAGLFDRAESLDVAGRRILRLEDHDGVAHSLMHHFSHYFDRRLKWLIDLRALVRHSGFEWGRVVQRLREWGGTVAGGASLMHLHKLDPQTIPLEPLRQLPLSRWRRALSRPLRSEHPLELFRHTRNRRTQLYLAAIMLERPWQLPQWLAHRALRDRREGSNPLDVTGRDQSGLTAERNRQ